MCKEIKYYPSNSSEKIIPTVFVNSSYERFFLVANRICVEKELKHLVDATEEEIIDFVNQINY